MKMCYMLLLSLIGATTVSSSNYGNRYRPILIDNLQCTGLESSLIRCNHTLLSSTSSERICDTTQDIAVQCATCK